MQLIIRFIITILCVAGISSITHCQFDYYNPTSKTISPSSPNAASLGKYGEYPVDFSSGLIDISIPLYKIQSSKLSLPITLKYHSSGIKVGDQASCVGLGWTLSAGGMISRTVREKIDEYNGYLTSQTDIRSTSTLDPIIRVDDFNYLKSFCENASGNIRDAQPDLFSYTLLNKSGSFFFDKDKTTIIPVPYDKIKVSTNPTALQSFTIIDTDGTIYLFGKTIDGNNCYENANMRTGVNDLETYAKTAWLLSAIISSDKTDTIQFSYTGDQIGYDYGITDQAQILDQHAGGGSQNNWHFPPQNWGMHLSTSVLNFTGMQLTLQQITFKNGKITFDKDARQDYGNLGKKINKISVYRLDALTGTYIKTESVSFGYDYFPSAYKRLKLTNLSINDETDAPLQKYSFTYNTSNPPSPVTRGLDQWGYYNGQDNNQTLLQDSYINEGSQNDPGALSGSAGTSNREPSLSAQSCVLTSVIYPTGGRTDFTYELNRYSEPNMPDRNAGGLRIKQVTSYDGNGGSPKIKTYTYGENEQGTGVLVTPINSYTYYQITTVLKYTVANSLCRADGQVPPPEQIRSRNFYSSPLTGLTGYDGRIVYYDNVTEYDGTTASNNGKTVYKYNYYGDPYIYNYVGTGKFFRQNYSWKRGQLLEKAIYTRFGQLVYKQVNGYGQIKQQWYGEEGYVVAPKFYIVEGSCLSTPECSTCPSRDYENMYFYNTFSIETGNYKLINTTDYIYDQKDISKVQVKQTEYEYDPSIYEPSKITKYTNDGSEVMNFKYPLSYNTNVTTSDAYINGIKNLTTLNDLTEIVETYKQKYKTDNTLAGTTEGVLTQFKADLPYPEAIYKLERTSPKTSFAASSVSGTAFTKDADYKAELLFNGYTNGNLDQQQKSNDISKSYLWDYNDALPIAEAVNCTKADIAYTSFESNGNGNWSGITASNVSSILSGYTGVKAYNFSGTALSKSGLTTATTYVVSYWSNVSTSYSVSGTAISGWPKSIKSVSLNGTTWYLWEHRVKSTASVTVSGSGYIDELRLHPLNAQMSTYTHTPLIGMTSATDANNITSFYEYDTMGRLKLIKDFKGNILKTYSYKYQSANP